MAKITENGIQIERLNDIIARLSQHFKTIYGLGINLSPDTPDGQLIGILAQMKMDFEQLAEMVYKQLDPDLATGAWLEQRAAYAGLVRRSAEYSYLRSVILTGEPYATIYRGLSVTDEHKNRWILVSDVQLNEKGSARADFRSELYGAYPLDSGAALTIETVVVGLSNATTSEQAELGVEEETDSQLRQRFFISRTKNATNSVDAIWGKIEELNDVRQVVVLENTTAEVDRKGVAPHSINVIVDGGNDAEIANVIFDNKGAGCGLQGNTEFILSRHGRARTIKFDRPSPIDIKIHLEISRINDFTEIDTTLIKKQLADEKFKMGEDIHISRLYSPINKVSGFYVKSLKIAKLGDDLSSNNISINVREIARIPFNQIEIEVS